MARWEDFDGIFKQQSIIGMSVAYLMTIVEAYDREMGKKETEKAAEGCSVVTEMLWD